MKNTILFLLLSLLLTSCHTPTQQERAEEFAAKVIKNQLYFPESYDPIECRIDTAYAPQETPETIEKLKYIASLYGKMQTAESEMKQKEDSYELYKSLGSYSSYNVYQTKEAKAEFEKAKKNFMTLSEKFSATCQEIAELNERPRELYSLKIVQSYRAQTNGGQVISSMVFMLVDFEMKDVIAMYNEDELESIYSLIDEFQQYLQIQY